MGELTPLHDVFECMFDLGYESGDFADWERRVQLFHVTPTGGLAFVADPTTPGLWWLDAYCPNEKPDNNTVKFLIGLCFAAGCQEIRSEIKRAGVGRMLRRVGFKDLGGYVYSIKAA